MKKTIAFLLMLLLLFSCSACGKDDQRNEGSGDSETEQQQPQDDDVQSEDSTDAPGKIVLDGTPVRWDEFPMPTAETFGLTGEDAIIYNAIAQVYNPKVYADTFSQSPEDVTDLSLPAFEIYEKSKSENGNTIYYGVFYECDYYNLALKKYEYLSAEKRKPEAICSFEELGDCVSGKEYVESEAENRRIEQLIDTFLCQIGEEKRNIFLCRYWYFDSIEEICRCTGYSQSKIKSMLFNIRKKLRSYLESEGVDL